MPSLRVPLQMPPCTAPPALCCAYRIISLKDHITRSCVHLYKTGTTTSKQCLKQSITYLEQAYVRTDADTPKSMHATGKARGMFKAVRSLLISICSESATLDFGFPCLEELARGRKNCYSSAVLGSS